MLKRALLVISIIPIAVFAGKLDRIKRAIEDSDYSRAFELIQKFAEKEPFNPGVSYYQAFLYQTTTFQQYQLDSARVSINKSMVYFQEADEKLVVELKEDGIDLEQITSLQTKIRDKQFQDLLSSLSIANVNQFRSKYPQSVYDETLDFKRDSILFTSIKVKPDQDAITEFITNYPASIFVPEAKDILDQLRYTELKTTGKLADHYQFLSSYPRTNFRSEIEEYILKYSTLDHAPESYLSFIEMSQTLKLKKKAVDLLFYTPNQRTNSVAKHPMEDSISTVSSIFNLRLFPVIDREKFGFLTEEGKSQIDYQFDDIHSDDKCKTIQDDWIFVKKEGQGLIINKLGRIIIYDVEKYINLTNGVALITANGQKYLYHKSGFKIIEEPIQGAEVLENRWIKVNRGGKSELISFLGVPITETKYDDIYLEGSFWIFEKRGLLAVYTEKLITDELHKKGLSLEFKFEDIEVVNDDMFIGFRDNRECLLDNEINFLIPWAQHTIYPDEAGWYLKSDKGYQLYNSLEKDVIDRYFPYLESNNGWLALKTQEDWMLLPRKESVSPSRGYDSLKLINDFIVYTEKEEDAQVMFNDGSLLSIAENDQLQTFPNSPYLSIRNKSNAALYSENGVQVVTGKFDQLTFLNDSLLKIEMKGKQGLMDAKGEFLIPPIFDVLDQQGQMIFVLDDNKIGCYDLIAQVMFTPKYESMPEKIGDHYSAKKNGKYGLFDLEEQSILNFEYDEIHAWQDSIFRVKQGSLYDFINYSGESIISGLELMKLLTTTADQEIWKFVKNGKYGLIGTKSGIILEPEFSDIFNISSAASPLFFADQHLDKAGFHVVSYVNEVGDLIYSKAYTKGQFDKILCED